MAGYLIRHWQGNLPISVSFFINLLGLNFILAYSSHLAPPGIFTSISPYNAAILVSLKVIFGFFILVWQMVGLLRCTFKQPSPLIKTFIVLLALAATINQTLIVYNNQQRYASIVKLALRMDTLDKFQLIPQPEIKVLTVSGPFGIGISNELRKILNQSDYEIIILNSPGGYIYEGREVAKLIKLHKLSTTSTSSCNSICTLAFVAGKHRFLAPGATLGFHQYSSIFLPGETLIQEQATDADTLLNYGITEPFIQRIYQTPPNQLWIPEKVDLLNAGIITQ